MENISTPKKRKSKRNWNPVEQKKYIQFLKKKGHLFEKSLAAKKKIKPHKSMSNFITTKDSIQCRSHHQKMMNKFKTIEAIIKSEAELFQIPREKPSDKFEKPSQNMKPDSDKEKNVEYEVKIEESPQILECDEVELMSFSYQENFFDFSQEWYRMIEE